MQPTIDLKRTLFQEIEAVEARINSALSNINNEKLRKAGAHILNAGGKRIRPAVMLAAYKSVGGKDLEKAYSVAAAMELIHNWTLIHDDIIDESDMRRSVSTVHTEWDRDVAILSGDMLNNLAFSLVTQSGFSPAVISRITNIISQASMDVIDGEMMDVDFEHQVEITESDYFEMISKKTGALFSASAMIGGIMGTQNEELINALCEYGRYIGLAFQVQDDLLDLIADEQVFGKEIGKDIKEGKRTLMVIYALEHANARDGEILRRILDKNSASAEEVKQALEIMQQTGAIYHALNMLEQFVNNALSQIKTLPEPEYKMALEELAHFIKDRIS